MPITVKVKGESGNIMRVNGENQIPVVVHPHPPKDEKETSIPYRAYFKNSSDSSDMAVDGSSTNVRFDISAGKDRDLYVRSVSVVIVDASQTLQEFGNLNIALTNGVLFDWNSTSSGNVVIHDGLKTNFDFIRLSQGKPAIGDGASAFLANNAVATNLEAYMPIIDFQQVFGITFGLRLRKGTADRISFTIRDNISAVDQFDAIAFGFEL